jgi:ADP-ribose pyrophosphatase
MKLGWSVKNSRVAWRGRFPVIEDLLRADHDGREHLYTYLGIKSTAVGVLAVDEQDRLLLVNEYRHPMGKVLTDIPMGTVERGENLVQAAARELREETGWIAGSLEHIGGLHPVPALTSLRFDFYLARDLSEGEAEPDETELIGVQWMDLGEAMRRLLAGELTHGGLPMALPLVLQKGILKLPDLDGGSG